MLQTFRRARSSWIVVGLLGLIMVAFIITGVGKQPSLGDIAGQSAGGLASVEGEAITSDQVNDQLNRQLARIRDQQPDADIATLVRNGLFDQLLDQMITSKAMTAFGREQGLSASKKMVDGDIASIPAFQNLAGKFDEQTFRRALANEKITEDQLRDDIATQLIQRQLLLPVAAAPKVPEAVARQYASLLLETRSGAVGLVPAQAFLAGPAPTEAELTAFYRKEQQRYTIPERRVLRYATFGSADVAAGAKASDAEIADYYRKNASLYAPSETRTVSQVVLPTQQAAQAFAAKVAGGKTFAQAAQEAGFAAADTALGTKSKADLARLSSPEVANAAFAAARGATTAPVRSPLGWHVVRVDAINTIGGRSLDAVRAEIAATVEQDKAKGALADLAARIDNAVGEGGSFEEIARANKLQVQETAPITASGAAPDIANFQLSAELRPLLKTGFDLNPDDDPVVETIVPDQRFALLAVARVVPAAAPPFAQIRDRVQQDFVRVRAAARARAVASAILAKVNSGAPLRQAFGGAGMALPPVQSLSSRRIEIAQQGSQVPPALAMLFSLPKGKARLIPAPNGGGWFVVQLEQIVSGDIGKVPGLVEATRQQFGQVVGPEYAEQFSRAVEREVEVNRDAEAIRKLKTRLQNNTSE